MRRGLDGYGAFLWCSEFLWCGGFLRFSEDVAIGFDLPGSFALRPQAYRALALFVFLATFDSDGCSVADGPLAAASVIFQGPLRAGQTLTKLARDDALRTCSGDKRSCSLANVKNGRDDWRNSLRRAFDASILATQGVHVHLGHNHLVARESRERLILAKGECVHSGDVDSRLTEIVWRFVRN